MVWLIQKCQQLKLILSCRPHAGTGFKPMVISETDIERSQGRGRVVLQSQEGKVFEEPQQPLIYIKRKPWNETAIVLGDVFSFFPFVVILGCTGS